MKILRVVAGAHRRSTGDHPPCPSHATLGETRGYRGGIGILKETLILAVGNCVRNVVLNYRTGKLLFLLVSQTDRKVRNSRTTPPPLFPRFLTRLLKEFLSGARCTELQRAT